MKPLEGHVVVVTGGGSGIGSGICLVLANQGATVGVTDIRLEAAEQVVSDIVAAGGTGTAFHHDVTSLESSHAVAQEVEKTLGPIDGLVNNAGISSRVRFEEMDSAEWDRMIAVNLTGVFNSTRAFIGSMIERGKGRIVSTSSFVGVQGLPLFSHYCASKFGVIGLTQSLALEYASVGITVNAVLPGVVRTALWEPLLKKVALEEGITPEQAWKNAIAPIPLGRPQDPEDIGNAVAFLLSDAARNITGATMNITGGQLLH